MKKSIYALISFFKASSVIVLWAMKTVVLFPVMYRCKTNMSKYVHACVTIFSVDVRSRHTYRDFYTQTKIKAKNLKFIIGCVGLNWLWVQYSHAGVSVKQ
jgi:hypothetical protein